MKFKKTYKSSDFYIDIKKYRKVRTLKFDTKNGLRHLNRTQHKYIVGNVPTYLPTGASDDYCFVLRPK